MAFPSFSAATAAMTTISTAFFRVCQTMGVRSPNSLRACGRDLVVWLWFLGERRDDKSVWSADREDVTAFHARQGAVRSLRIGSRPPHWNRSVAALEKFYGWAVEEGLVTASPGSAKPRTTSTRFLCSVLRSTPAP